MKTTIALFALTLGVFAPLANASASPHSSDTALTQRTDISAAKKKRVYVHRAAPYGYYHNYPRAFSPGDPSYQSPEQIRLRALNRCFFDLGYGRWQNCN